MPAIGPQYLPISVIAAWRCLTSTSGLACAKASATKPAAKARATPLASRLFFIALTPPRNMDGTLPNRLQTPRRPRYSGSPQSSHVLGNRLDFAIVHAHRHPAHHAVRVIGAGAGAKCLELRLD